MMQFSDVQRANLTLALLIREAVRENPGAACCKFGLSSEQLQMFQALTPEEILTGVSHAGEQALFSLNAGFASLLKHQSPIAALVASAQPRSKLTPASRVSC